MEVTLHSSAHVGKDPRRPIVDCPPFAYVNKVKERLLEMINGWFLIKYSIKYHTLYDHVQNLISNTINGD